MIHLRHNWQITEKVVLESPLEKMLKADRMPVNATGGTVSQMLYAPAIVSYRCSVCRREKVVRI